MSLTISRRYLISTLGVGGIAAALPIRVRATTRQRPRILLLDASLPAREFQTAANAHPMAQLVRIEGDLVRLWRAGLGRDIVAANGGALAIVSFHTAVLLSGLAREARLPVAQTQVGRTAFQISFGINDAHAEEIAS